MNVTDTDRCFFLHIMRAFRYIERSEKTHTQWMLPTTSASFSLMIIRSVHPANKDIIRMEARIVKNPDNAHVYSYTLKSDDTLIGPVWPRTIMRSQL
jgi:hypothetical protein